MGDMVVADVKERPILFSGEMVRAILDGRKTQTRRVIKPQPDEISVRVIDDKCAEVIWSDPKHLENRGGGTRDGGRDILQGMVYERCRYGQPGDRLWVRETFYQGSSGYTAEWGEWVGVKLDDKALVKYPATDGEVDTFWTNAPYRHCLVKRPSIFMPRWASRLTLEVVSVRVERVQEISGADVTAEGFGTDFLRHERFERLWDEINGKRAPWAINPWVWVVEFKRVQS